MSWLCLRQLKAPWPGLPCPAVSVSDTVEIRLTLASNPIAQADNVSHWLRELSGDHTLSVESTLRWKFEPLPPPWQRLSWQEYAEALETATQAEILLSLRLLSAKDLGRPPYANAKERVNRFTKQTDHPKPDTGSLAFRFSRPTKVVRPARYHGQLANNAARGCL